MSVTSLCIRTHLRTASTLRPRNRILARQFLQPCCTRQLLFSISQNAELEYLHPSTSSWTCTAFVHSFATLLFCDFNTPVQSTEHRASIARCSASPCHPNT